MANRVLMPKGSDTMTEGKVLKWLKKEGEKVSSGDAVVEIETDKVDMEVESVGEGVLRKVLVPEGKVVPVGELLAVIGSVDEDIAPILKAGEAPKEAEAPAAARTAQAVSAPLARPQAPASAPAGQVAAGGVPKRGRILASPLARRIARENGIDLAMVVGSGPGGRIVRQDVERAVELAGAQRRLLPPPAAGVTAPPPRAAAVALPPRPVAVPSGPEYRDEPLSSMRKTIANRLAESLGPVPHFYLTVEADMKRAMELRDSANTLDPELRLSYNDVIVKACAAALRVHPEVNASFMGDSVRYHNRVHVGIAVAVEGGGLITPVIRDCDRKSLQLVSMEAKELVARARARKLQPDEYVGATFTVSNLGMMGIEEFSAVINPPEGAILAVGSVVAKPVVTDNRIEIGHRCRMTLSCDHRVIDGATAARFLQTLKNILENPVYLAF